MHLTSLEALIAVILGTGGIGKGAWGAVAAMLRRAQAVEAFRGDVRQSLANHSESIGLLTEIAAQQSETTARHDQQLADHDSRLNLVERAHQCATETSRSLPAPVSTRSP